ncbi:MAG: Radical protein [Ignavibacteria bacterium]|nr:Radical protein [Ignavibacteria bacterium]
MDYQTSKLDLLIHNIKECSLCPHECRIDRTSSRDGKCGMGDIVRIASYGPHFGEEPELVGRGGSGTIFLSGCNLLCRFCQNFEISHYKEGFEITIEELAEIILKLQAQGCSNINFVTPTHFAAQIAQAIIQSRNNGLSIPIVYNCGGYENVETIKLMDGLIDIYMPDFKFFDNYLSGKFTNAKDYFEHASNAIIEMHRQVGDLVIKNGTARRGLLIRHLVMPQCAGDSREIINFIVQNFGKDTYLNLMDQYYPRFRAYEFPEISELISKSDYEQVVSYARKLGFHRPKYIFGE